QDDKIYFCRVQSLYLYILPGKRPIFTYDATILTKLCAKLLYKILFQLAFYR
ncbi:MAG: hypothetical protein ACD_45C00718G0005, partial [uncultured bacterium]